MSNSLLNQLHCANCSDFMPKLGSDSVDLVVTSPPYDKIRKYKGFDFDFEKIAEGLWDVIKPGGVCCWVVNDQVVNGGRTLTCFRQALFFQQLGFLVHDIIIFEKNTSMYQHKTRYGSVYEFIFVLSKGKMKTFNPIMIKGKYPNYKRVNQVHRQETKTKKWKVLEFNDKRIKDNIWKYSVSLYGATKDKIAFQHPAVFPEKLAVDCIHSWSNEGDVVLDPMCGSGTVPKMAKLTNRKWIGVDISQEYIDLANQRLNLYGW